MRLDLRRIIAGITSAGRLHAMIEEDDAGVGEGGQTIEECSAADCASSILVVPRRLSRSMLPLTSIASMVVRPRARTCSSGFRYTSWPPSVMTIVS